MYLASIDLFGFKSFAQKTHINFSPGVTAIVGPNGCGKSNIVDAVRWVLGEQREAALRSERMENVIFGGTNKRRPLSLAEISMTLHDTDGLLPVEYEEVTITRRLFRSGKSEYLLNKSVCRLRDLLDLLMGTGIGPDAYSIMELKMVEDVLSDNPEQLRRLLDESLGITRYKLRRKEALRRLADARLDRDRAQDILAEVERQGKALKRQVAKAKAYKRLQDKAGRIRSALVLIRLRQLEQDLAPLQETIRLRQAEQETCSADLATVEAELMRMETELLAQENERHGAASQYETAQSHYQNSRTDLSKLDEEMRSLAWRIERNEEERQKINAESGRLSQQVETAQRMLQERDEGLPALQATLSERRQAFTLADQQFREIRQAAQRSRDELSHLHEQQAQIIRAAEQRAASNQSLQDRRSGLQQKQQELRNDLSLRQAELTGSQADLEAKLSQLAQAQKEYAEHEARSEDLQNQKRLLERELDRNSSQRQQAQAQIEHLQELHRRSSPLYSAGGALASKFPDAISGALADELQLDERYLPAVETALAGMAFSRVIETTDHFDSILEFLASETAGRAALLVGHPPHYDISAAQTLAQAIGGQALAAVIESTTTVARWVGYFLRHVVLVGSRADLRRFASQAAEAGLALVTLAGEFTDGRGLWVLGGTRDEVPRVIGLSSRRSVLERRLSELEEGQTAIRNNIAALHALQIEAHAAFERAAEARRQGEDRHEGALRLKLQKEAQVVSLDLLLQQSLREFAEVESQLASLTPADSGERTDLDGLEAKVRSLQFEQQEQSRAEAAALEARETARVAFDEIQMSHERANAEIARTRDQMAQLHQRLEELAAELEGLAQSDRQGAERLEALKLDRQIQGEKVAQAAADMQQVRLKLEEYDTSRMELQESQRQANNQVRACRARLDELSQAVHQAQLQSVELEAAIREERKKLEGINTDGLEDEQADEEILAKIERKILSLEPLNLAAEKEYQELAERQTFLTSQLQDLDQAETDLQQTIAALNREAKERFEGGFERIKQNFQKVFLDVFEGGKAELTLSGDDPLEADVELLAAPAGKRIGSLSLLSGGEKALTAISLLFAIYLEKPSPFCILDEIDAPLDDENTMRFCRLLQNFTGKTQFLVITHNKRTMTQAQQLLGVTMEEEGISKVVPVKLN